MNKRERIDKVKKYDIVALAEDLGFTPKKVSSNFYTIEEHDSLRMKISTNTFSWYSKGHYGDTISLAMTLGCEIDKRFKSFDYAINFIENKMSKNPDMTVTIKKNVYTKKDFCSLEMPKSAKDNLKVYYYLKNRCIDIHIIDYFLKNKYVYQEKEKNNLVFVSYKDEKPVFLTEKGIIPGGRYMREFSGNDYNHCFYIDNNKDELLVTEAIIDLMSIMTIEKECTKYNYLSINSVTKDAAIYHHLETNPSIKKVLLRLDNDDAGIKATHKIEEKLKNRFPDIEVNVSYPPVEKDWNDYLVYKINHREKENEFSIIF